MTLICNAAQLPSMRRRKLLRETYFASGRRARHALRWAMPRSGQGIETGLRFTVLELKVGEEMRDVCAPFSAVFTVTFRQ